MSCILRINTSNTTCVTKSFTIVSCGSGTKLFRNVSLSDPADTARYVPKSSALNATALRRHCFRTVGTVKRGKTPASNVVVTLGDHAILAVPFSPRYTDPYIVSLVVKNA